MAKVKFTAPKVLGFKCPAAKAQAFLWDATAPGLGLRATRAGKPAYVFQAEYRGPLRACDHRQPRRLEHSASAAKGRELQRQIDEGRDPREVKAETIAADVARREADKGEVLTVADVWPRYMAEGKPKRRNAWKPRYVADLKRAAAMGGEPKKRGKGTTKPGIWPP